MSFSDSKLKNMLDVVRENREVAFRRGRDLMAIPTEEICSETCMQMGMEKFFSRNINDLLDKGVKMNTGPMSVRIQELSEQVGEVFECNPFDCEDVARDILIETDKMRAQAERNRRRSLGDYDSPPFP